MKTYKEHLIRIYKYMYFKRCLGTQNHSSESEENKSVTNQEISGIHWSVAPALINLF